MKEIDRRTFIIKFGGALAALGVLAACGGNSSVENDPDSSIDIPDNQTNDPALPDISVRNASEVERNLAGKYYPLGVLNQNIEVEGLCNVWMAGEPLNPRQSSGLPVNGETLAIATWRFNLGSKVVVTNIDNGRSVVAVVTDRGPNEIGYPGHICDITPLIARRIAGGKGSKIRIRLSPFSGQAITTTSESPISARSNSGDQVCVSNFKSGLTRKVGEPPHPGDQSRCIAGPDGKPTWVSIK